MARIVVSGYMIRHPLAGNLYAYYHYVLGLHRLGHRVCYVEESGGWVNPCYDPATGDYSEDPGPGLAAVRSLLDSDGAGVPVCYVHRDSGRLEGMTWSELRYCLREADLLLNVGGLCWLPEFRLCRRRALVDLDPLFTQLGRFGGRVLGEHDVHFSYGVNVGRPGCTVPTAGVDWVPTVPPVVLDAWDPGDPPPGAPFTTIASWNSYGEVFHEGVRYGQKDEELVRCLSLPSLTSQPLELAIAIREDVRADVQRRFRAAGWSVRDAADVSTDVRHYRAYIRASRGELSVAKHAYVETRSGWFSDRSVCYLAAGLPVVLQNTGFSDWLPVGKGVFAFSSVDDAAECIARVNAAYSTHRQAAREIAETTFAHSVVLPTLIKRCLGEARST